MTERVAWQYNDELQQWESTLSRWQGIVRLVIENGVYLASLLPRNGTGPEHMAPHAFASRDDAQAWCEAEVQQFVALERGEISSPLT